MAQNTGVFLWIWDLWLDKKVKYHIFLFSPCIDTGEVSIRTAWSPAHHSWNIVTRCHMSGWLNWLESCNKNLFCDLFARNSVQESHHFHRLMSPGGLLKHSGGLSVTWHVMMCPDLSHPDTSPCRPPPPRRTACWRWSSCWSSHSYSWKMLGSISSSELCADECFKS